MRDPRFLVGALLAALLVACAGGGQSPGFTPQNSLGRPRHGTAGQITLYNLPDGSAQGITAGGGALWAVQWYPPCPNNSHIAQITTDGTVTEYPLGFCDATTPVTGPDGALWVSSQAGVGLPLGRFTPGSSGFTDFGTNQPTIGFYGLTAGSDNAIWIAAGSEIVRSDTNGVMINYTVPANQDPATYSIAAGPDQALWFTEGRAGVDKIGRITTSGITSDYQIPTPNSYAYGITAGPASDGAMWFVEHDADKVGRIDMSGNITEYPLPSGAGAYGIATGPDGNLWIAENGSNKIAQMTTSGSVTEYSLPPSCNYGCGPLFITAGPDGAMWFTLCPGACSPHVPGQIGRITTIAASERRTHQQHTDKLRILRLPPPNLFRLGATQR